MKQIILTNHAKFEAHRRNIPEEIIKSAIFEPQQKLPAKKGRVIIQNRYFDKTENREMLLRVIGLETSDEFKVITLYKTSKIKKYWIGGG